MLAQSYFERASAEGDPRYVGYAEGALRPWKDAAAPPEILFARALLRQYRHDFDGALADLAQAVQREPTLVEARAWRAAIFMVRAEYAAAGKECAALSTLSSELLATGCSAYVEATTGKAREAYQRLSEMLRRHPEAGPYARLWALTRLAEMAARLGDDVAAERHFRAALALGVTDNFLLAAYADFLLEHKRAAEVVTLLKDWERSDTLLLRLALAGQRLGLPAAEKLHLAEEARYFLDLKRDPRAALAAAAENWKSQREPRDARALLEAALAAGDRAAAAPALRWLADSGYEDARLHELAARLR